MKSTKCCRHIRNLWHTVLQEKGRLHDARPQAVTSSGENAQCMHGFCSPTRGKDRLICSALLGGVEVFCCSTSRLLVQPLPVTAQMVRDSFLRQMQDLYFSLQMRLARGGRHGGTKTEAVTLAA